MRTDVRMWSGRIGASGRVVRPAPVLGIEVARRVLRVAISWAVLRRPYEHGDAGHAADHPYGAPDRVGQGGERQCDQVRSTTIVFTEAVTPSATSTTTT